MNKLKNFILPLMILMVGSVCITSFYSCNEEETPVAIETLEAIQQGKTIQLSWIFSGGSVYYDILRNDEYICGCGFDGYCTWGEAGENIFIDENPVVGLNTYEIRTKEGVTASISYEFVEENASDNDHAYVDLGLSVKWATCNIGASRPEEYGSYFSWGEIEPKDVNQYNWGGYKWCSGAENSLTKYNTNSYYGTVDNKKRLDKEDDAAYVTLGGNWRMPTKEELDELVNNCTWIATTQNGTDGYNVVGSNGNSVFLPAAGMIYESGPANSGWAGAYWTSSLNIDYMGAEAVHITPSHNEINTGAWDRYNGYTIRPVWSNSSDNSGDDSEDGDNENPEMASYYIKHPWNGEDWTWQLMAQEDGSYTYIGVWNGIGANINTSADDNGSAWYPSEDIYGSEDVANGSTVTFVFTPYEGVDGSLIISTKESDNGDDNNGSGDDNTGDDNNGSGDDNGEGNTPTESLDKPSNVRATLDGESSIKVTWSSVSGASGYYVYRSSSANGYYEKIGDRYQTSYYDNSPLEGSNYYKIKAYNASMTSEYSEYALCTYSKEEEITKPNAPTGVSAEAYSSYIKITWNYVNGADSYKVYRSTSANGTYSSLQTTSSTSYTDYDASEGTTYYYKVTAINSAGESNKSSYASAKIEPQVSKPSTPTGLSAYASSSCIELSWNSVSGADSYYIYRGTSSYNCSYYDDTYSTSYRDCDVSEGKTYYYKVSAKNSAGESSQSSSASAEIKATNLDVPSNVKASYDSYYGVQITWKEVPLADKYYVYRSKYRNSGYSKVGEASYGVYVDNNLPSGDKYSLYYKIQAYSSYVNKTSDYSEVAEVYIDKNPFPPCAPQITSASANYGFTLKWNNPTSSGCGTPTTQVVKFFDSSTNKWVETEVTSNYYSISSSKFDQYTNDGYYLQVIIQVQNSHGCAATELFQTSNMTQPEIREVSCY